jgi:pyridoxal/pyridoxine/pyridoxamine kinase
MNELGVDPETFIKLAQTGENVEGFFSTVGNFFKGIGDFFSGLFGGN